MPTFKTTTKIRCFCRKFFIGGEPRSYHWNESDKVFHIRDVCRRAFNDGLPPQRFMCACKSTASTASDWEPEHNANICTAVATKLKESIECNVSGCQWHCNCQPGTCRACETCPLCLTKRGDGTPTRQSVTVTNIIKPYCIFCLTAEVAVSVDWKPGTAVMCEGCRDYRKKKDPSAFADKLFRFVCGLDLADHSVAEQKTLLELVHEGCKVMGRNK